MPAAISISRAGCIIAVERMSAPVAARSVMGGVGSTQMTLKPAVPKAAAALRPAIPPPEIRMSQVCMLMGAPFVNAHVGRGARFGQAACCLPADLTQEVSQIIGVKVDVIGMIRFGCYVNRAQAHIAWHFEVAGLVLKHRGCLLGQSI